MTVYPFADGPELEIRDFGKPRGHPRNVGVVERAAMDDRVAAVTIQRVLRTPRRAMVVSAWR